MSGSWTKGRDQFFPCETWSVNYEWYWKLQFDHAQILYILGLGLKKVWYQNFINIAKFSWENSKPSWRYQNFSSMEEDVHVHSPPIYGRSDKWRNTINEMDGNILGGNFWVGIFRGKLFQGGVWWVGIFRVGIFPGGIFLEPSFLFIGLIYTLFFGS